MTIYAQLDFDNIAVATVETAGEISGVTTVVVDSHEVIGKRWTGAGWVSVSTLAERKAAIDAQRDATLDAGVMWDGKIWHADSTFQAQLTAFIGAFTGGLLPAQATVTIRSMDNVNNVLTLDQLKALALTVMAFVQTTYAASWAAKDAL